MATRPAIDRLNLVSRTSVPLQSVQISYVTLDTPSLPALFGPPYARGNGSW